MLTICEQLVRKLVFWTLLGPSVCSRWLSVTVARTQANTHKHTFTHCIVPFAVQLLWNGVKIVFQLFTLFVAINLEIYSVFCILLLSINVWLTYLNLPIYKEGRLTYIWPLFTSVMSLIAENNGWFWKNLEDN